MTPCLDRATWIVWSDPAVLHNLPFWYNLRHRSSIWIPKHLFSWQTDVCERSLGNLRPGARSVSRMDEVHFNPWLSTWGVTRVRGTPAKRTHVRGGWDKLMVLSRSLNFLLRRRITPASYPLELPIRPLSMCVSVIKHNYNMTNVTIPEIIAVNMFCFCFHLLKAHKGRTESCEVFSRTQLRVAAFALSLIVSPKKREGK